MKKINNLLVLIGLLSAAQADNFQDLNLTIYNNNMALVSEQKDFKVSKGLQSIQYENVSKNIIFDSINSKFFESGISTISKSFKPNSFNIQNLLKRTIGKKIKYMAPSNGTKDTYLEKDGTLVSASPTMILTDENKLISVSSNNIVFSDINPLDDFKPTVTWDIHSAIKDDIKMNLTYLTKNLSWKTNYILDIDPDTNKASLESNINVVNNTGIDYNNAKVNFFSGQVNKIKDHRQNMDSGMMMKSFAMDSVSSYSNKAPTTQSVSSYYVINLPNKISFQDKEEKSLLYFTERDIDIKQKATLMLNPYSSNTKNNPIVFKNNYSFHLNNSDLIVPQGNIQVYESKDQKFYIGSSLVNNSKPGEEISLDIGTDFDIKATHELKQGKHLKIGLNTRKTVRSVDYEINVKNNSDKIKEVEISVPQSFIQNAVDKVVHKCETCTFVKEDYINKFKFSLKSKGSEKLSLHFKRSSN